MCLRYILRPGSASTDSRCREQPDHRACQQLEQRKCFCFHTLLLLLVLLLGNALVRLLSSERQACVTACRLLCLLDEVVLDVLNTIHSPVSIACMFCRHPWPQQLPLPLRSNSISSP